jgi:hypothetical protein
MALFFKIRSMFCFAEKYQYFKPKKSNFSAKVFPKSLHWLESEIAALTAGAF